MGCQIYNPLQHCKDQLFQLLFQNRQDFNRINLIKSFVVIVKIMEVVYTIFQIKLITISVQVLALVINLIFQLEINVEIIHHLMHIK